MKLLIDKLLVSYFNFVSYKIMFCLACLEEEIELIDDIVKILKKSQLKKKKSSLKIKIKKKFKIKSEFQDLFIKILFLK